MVWLIMAGGSAPFAGITSVLAKAGLRGVDSNLATAIRTTVVLLFSWSIVFLTGEQQGLTAAGADVWCFLILSGLATGLSWLCYYYALQNGPASVVVPIDKLSVLVTVAFSVCFLHETLGKREAAGLALLTGGTLLMLL